MRLLLGAVTIATIGLSCAGAAASLGGVSSPALASGSTAVARCDADGFVLVHSTVGGRVATVTVSGIADPGCTGGELSLELTSGGVAVGSGGPVTVPADADAADDDVAVSIAPQPLAQHVDGFFVSVVGP